MLRAPAMARSGLCSGLYRRDAGAQGRGLLGELQRIKTQPVPATVTLFSRLVVWLFAWLMFLRLAAYLDQSNSATVWT